MPGTFTRERWKHNNGKSSPWSREENHSGKKNKEEEDGFA